ncbi:homogentisate 1,2-dioxygenase [Mycobacterium sp. E1747]|uniref:homogentisate 1,2-dioxygenase n=1 Tax=Mycobacterium sp. E1747 TaxID=1834128 RepID=UPI0007FDF727|nr:homogentisate 1,2-dioxygenase [Mycobacterium sp. E1747]OBH13566.1 homogentisate 1,2-dioxygenase [Mycobacterium sp. E1747]
MPYYRQVGSVSPKRHTQHRADDGQLLYEELMGADGFSSDSSLLYHRHIPSGIVAADEWRMLDQTTVPNHPLKPRHLQPHQLFPPAAIRSSDAVTGRRLLLGNADLRISYVAAAEVSPLYRNAIGDEVVFIESGTALIESVFGELPAQAGDYVVVPRGTTHRWMPEGIEPLRAYVIEANSHVSPPKRFLARLGQFLEHAPYCERDLHGPVAPLCIEGHDVEVLVKHRGTGGILGTRLVYEHHPFDVVGWDGCLYPFTFNIADYEPITGRVHQPPPAHQVFEGHNFVICNFVPRKVDYHPQAIPAPYYHSNVDSDEVMFYVKGDYAARHGSGIGAGSISLHPGGHAHGPQPGAYGASIGVEQFDEIAVMVDTFRPFELGEAALACDDPGYAWTWSEPKGRQTGVAV